MTVQCVDPARDVAPFNGCGVGWTNREPSTRAASDCNDGSSPLRAWVQCWTDSDRDSYRASSTGGIYSCYQSSNPGYGGCPDRRTSRATNDCCDTDADARPGATGWFTSPRSCGGYDYDCNGSTQLQYTSTATTDASECTTQGGSGLCLDVPAGWSTSRPSCGNSATWISGCTRTLVCGPPDCPSPAYACLSDGASRTQGCH